MSFPAGQFRNFDLDSIGAVASGASFPVRLNKASAIGRTTKGGSRAVPKCAGIEIVTALSWLVNSTTADGVIPGRRAHETISRVQLSPNQWIKKFSHDLSAKALRRIVNYDAGRSTHLDSADIADADATVTPTISIFIPFWDENAIEPSDTCPDLVNVGDGSLELTVAAPAIDGVSTVSVTSGRATVYWFWGKPGVPVFRVMQERAIESQTRYRLNLQGDYLKKAFLMVNGSQGSSTSHLPGSYEESNSLQLQIGGERLSEDLRLDDHIRQLNNTNFDAAIDESVTVPEVYPLVMPIRGQRATKLAQGAGDSWAEHSAVPFDTATGSTATSNVITDELFAARPGTATVESYRAASASRTLGTLVHGTADKVRGVSGVKSGALPLVDLAGKAS